MTAHVVKHLYLTLRIADGNNIVAAEIQGDEVARCGYGVDVTDDLPPRLEDPLVFEAGHLRVAVGPARQRAREGGGSGVEGVQGRLAHGALPQKLYGHLIIPEIFICSYRRCAYAVLPCRQALAYERNHDPDPDPKSRAFPGRRPHDLREAGPWRPDHRSG